MIYKKILLYLWPAVMLMLGPLTGVPLLALAGAEMVFAPDLLCYIVPFLLLFVSSVPRWLIRPTPAVFCWTLCTTGLASFYGMFSIMIVWGGTRNARGYLTQIAREMAGTALEGEVSIPACPDPWLVLVVYMVFLLAALDLWSVYPAREKPNQ
jgi:hypothetical protein